MTWDISKYQLFWWCDTCLRCSLARVSGNSVDCLTISGNSRHEFLVLSPCLVLQVPPNQINPQHHKQRKSWVSWVSSNSWPCWIIPDQDLISPHLDSVEICGIFPRSPKGFSRQVVFPPFEASSYSVDQVDEAPASPAARYCGVEATSGTRNWLVMW